MNTILPSCLNVTSSLSALAKQNKQCGVSYLTIAVPDVFIDSSSAQRDNEWQWRMMLICFLLGVQFFWHLNIAKLFDELFVWTVDKIFV